MDEREREIREDEALWADLQPPATIRYLLSLLDQEREQKAELLEALEDAHDGMRSVRLAYGDHGWARTAMVVQLTPHEERAAAVLAKHEERV